MKTNSISDWIKENSWGLLGLVFVAGGLFYNIKDNGNRLTTIENRLNKQDDYNDNIDQKIDDIKAWISYEKGRQAGIKEMQEQLKK